MHLDMIAKQYKKETRTGVERGKNGVGMGSRTGLERGKKWVGTGGKTGFKRHKKRNLARFNNFERCGTAVLHRSSPFFTRF